MILRWIRVMLNNLAQLGNTALWTHGAEKRPRMARMNTNKTMPIFSGFIRVHSWPLPFAAFDIA